MFTITEAIMKRLKVRFGHAAALLSSVKRLNRDAAAVFDEIDPDHAAAKELCNSVFNGKRIPEHLSQNSFLSSLRKEGIFMRWVAISVDPEMHDRWLQDSERRHPEATTWFYMWTAVEDFILECWVDYVLSKEVCHLSLHYDGIMLDRH
eukprot:10211122-Karenia_brevis.AAC.1